jgi:hypothetical protein
VDVGRRAFFLRHLQTLPASNPSHVLIQTGMMPISSSMKMFGTEEDMATTTFPLRELSVAVQHEAVSAQRAYWKLAEGKAHQGMEPMLWLKTRVLKIAMGKLVARQQSLITRLKNSPPERFAPEMYGKLASDLHNVVSLTNSLLDELYGMPTECINLWSTKLEEIADCNGYLDNFAESFRIASDDACTALLADIAAKVTAESLATSH